MLKLFEESGKVKPAYGRQPETREALQTDMELALAILRKQFNDNQIYQLCSNMKHTLYKKSALKREIRLREVELHDLKGGK